MYHFKNKIPVSRNSGFTLLEVIAAIAILAIVVSTVLVVTNNCMVAAMDTKAKIEAFNIARENMETVLSQKVIEEYVEYGYDEINPDMEWETEVKSFTEPITSKMWIQATCSASYTDSNSERQSVELTHWVTGLSDSDMKKIQNQNRLTSGLGKDKPEEQEDTAITYQWLVKNIPDKAFWPIFISFMEPAEAAKVIEALKNPN